MCCFNAYKTNKACREIDERIVEKGKSKKLTLIALCPAKASTICDIQVAIEYDDREVIKAQE